MARLLTLVMLGIFGLVALVGCRAEGEVGETHSGVVAPR